MIIRFLHGWTSAPGGKKPTFLSGQSHKVLNPALPADDFDGAVTTAQGAFDRDQHDVVVGSSHGGAVAMNIRLQRHTARLVVSCLEKTRKGQGSQTEHDRPAFTGRRRRAVRR